MKIFIYVGRLSGFGWYFLETVSKLNVVTAGMIVFDIIAADIDRFADQGEMMFIANKVHVRPGGHPLNVALDLVGIGANPEKIGTVAAVGKDTFGDFLEQELSSYLGIYGWTGNPTF